MVHWVKAIWNNQVIAESAKTVIVEGNHYFPRESINTEFFVPSETHPMCGWKGTASYYGIEVDGKDNVDAAWYYPSTKNAAKSIEGYIAFWKGVEITK